MRISDWSSDVCSSDLTSILGLRIVRNSKARLLALWLTRMTRFTVNGNPVEYLLDPGTPLLWALRDASPYRREIWLRRCELRRMHGHCRWRGGERLHRLDPCDGRPLQDRKSTRLNSN